VTLLLAPTLLVACVREGDLRPAVPGANACSAAGARCEEAIARALLAGDDPRELLEALAAERANQGRPQLKQLLGSLAENPAPVVLLTKNAGQTRSLPQGVKAVEADLGSEDPAVFVALADVSKTHVLAVIEPDSSVTRYYGRDPIRTFAGGALPYATSAVAPDWQTEKAVEEALRETLAAASKFDYVAAARAVDKLEQASRELAPWELSKLRANMALAAVNLSRVSLTDDSTPTQPNEPWPNKAGSPYYELLRFSGEAKHTEGSDERVRAAVQSLGGGPNGAWFERRYRVEAKGCPPTEALTFTKPADVGLAHFLPTLLAREGSRERAGKLPLADWDKSYGALVELSEREGLAFYTLPVLLSERGGFVGMKRSGVAAHRRVTELAKKHIEALQRLAQEMPGRVSVNQLSFVGSPGAFLDPVLAPELKALAERSSSDSVAEAKDASELLRVAMMGGLISMNMPPVVREGYVGSLASSYVARLRGDLSSEVGFWAAGAHTVELLYRAFSGYAADPQASLAAITRALEQDPNLPEAGLASLAAALFRYGVLAQTGSLGAIHLEQKDAPLPGRKEARAALIRAISKLHSQAPADPTAVAELAGFVDNVAAAVAYSLHKTFTAPPAADVCADDAPADPKLQRALAKLRDQRKAVLSHASLSGEGGWAVRARLLTILLSDAIDIAAASQQPAPKGKAKPKATTASSFDPDTLTKFFVSEADARVTTERALATFDLSPFVGPAAGAFQRLVRGYFESGTGYFRGKGQADVALLFNGVGSLWGPETSVLAGLMVDFARAWGAGSAVPSSISRFTQVAEDLYKQGKKTEADLVLVASTVAGAMNDEGVPEEAIASSRKYQGEAAWLLDFMRYSRGRVKVAPGASGPLAFEQDLKRLASDQCANVSVETVSGVLGALQQLKSGDRGGARLALDRMLTNSDPLRFNVPHVSYVFQHASGHRASNIALSLDLASPLVLNGSGFNVGSGFSSIEEDKFELDVTVESADSKPARDGSARYFVQANALLAVLHFMDNDLERGEEAAMRALGTVLTRTAFYEPNVTGESSTFAVDGLVTFAVLAQLAIERERPLLAGDLLQVARGQLEANASRESIEESFDSTPDALASVPGITEVIARARKTFLLSTSGMKCVGTKLDKQAFVQPTCSEYSRAIALRAADATTAHPLLKDGKRAAECEHGLTDAFMRKAFTGDYDQDRLLSAAVDLQKRGKRYDAWVLLTRLRHPGHCAPGVRAALKNALQTTKSTTHRADLMSARLNCELGESAETLSNNLGELRDELITVGDPSRELQAGVVAAALSASRSEPKLAKLFPGNAGFMERHRRSLAQLPAALFLDHAARILNDEKIELEANAADFALICPSEGGDLGQLCNVLKKLRDPEVSTEEKKRIASEAALAAAK
jgi:hypothetical protein